jgi:hypothetical protein
VAGWTERRHEEIPRCGIRCCGQPHLL